MKFRQVTEENSLYDHLEQQPVRDLLRDINREDHRVADAVEACLPQVEAFVVRALPRIQQEIPSSASLPEETRRSGRR